MHFMISIEKIMIVSFQVDINIKYRGWTMKLKHLVLQHNNLLVW